MGYWQRPILPELPDLTPESERTVPKTLTRIISHLTRKNYGQKFLKNLAPGANPLELDRLGLRGEARELFEWHNGYINPFGCYVCIIPWQLQLLSVGQALAHYEIKMDTAGVDALWWNEDIWPVMAAPDAQDFVIVSKSTGRAAYRNLNTDLTDEESVQWFKSLYDLLRPIELSAQEGKLSTGDQYGEPFNFDELGANGEQYEYETDTSDEDDDEDEDEDEDEAGIDSADDAAERKDHGREENTQGGNEGRDSR